MIMLNTLKKKPKKVYKSLSKTYHPDMNDSSLASDKFMEINEAWKKISEERNFK